MGTAVIDASVLIGALDPADGLHEGAVQALRKARLRHRVVVPAIAFAEIMVGAVTAGPEVEAVVVEFLGALGSIEPLTPEMADRGARIRSAHGLALPDALILGTAAALGATVILTGDERWRSVDRRVRVVGDETR